MNEFKPLLGATLGALLVGFTVSCMLYGVTSAQCYFFLRRDIQNGQKFRIIICVLWFLETVQFVMVSHSVYHYAIARHGIINSLADPIWTLIAHIIPTYLIIGIVQYIWIMRIWTLSSHPLRTWIAGGMIGVIMLDWGICTDWISIHVAQKQWADIHRDWVTICSIVLIAFNDILATALLCLILHNSRSGIRQTDNIITVLMAYALNTGLLTCLVSIVTLILIFFTPLEFYYIALYIIFGRLYINSLLAMLNWRRGKVRTRRRRFGRREDAFELSTVPWGWRPPSSSQ
ncbi:hypothetical protein BV22DRAFT_1110934 [Leucogyrophana mollusca]|uniref:Uncharacterized protein n=1 Tax=Leucogyrophana mollusca TaxID=85980 RepID=A0ACB8BS42_9AGAM|nr:hypothetical protein BV22DRAFT_1110934 [Leucogyrophana mollusca]